MEYQGKNPIDIDGLYDMFKKVSSDPKMPPKMMGALRHLFEAASTILETKGEKGWSHTLLPQMSETERTAFEEKVQPVVDFLLKIQDENVNNRLQEGGGPDIDGLFETVINKMNSLNEWSEKFASENGILGMEKDADESEDYQPLSLVTLIPYVGQNPVGVAISKTPVPFRLLVFIGYSILDMVRILFYTSGIDSPRIRQLLSIGMAVLDILKGDWKGSLLDLAGVLSNSGVLVGFIMKTCLHIFGLMSTDLQDEFTFVVFKGIKSILIGFALKMFQITAPLAIRQPIIENLKLLATKSINVDNALLTVNLPKRKPFYSPDYSDMPSVLATIRDPTIVCTNEYQTLMEPASKSIFLSFALQLANIPMKQGDKACEKLTGTVIKRGYRTYGHLLVAEGFGSLLNKEIAEEIVNEGDIQNNTYDESAAQAKIDAMKTAIDGIDTQLIDTLAKLKQQGAETVGSIDAAATSRLENLEGQIRKLRDYADGKDPLKPAIVPPPPVSERRNTYRANRVKTKEEMAKAKADADAKADAVTIQASKDKATEVAARTTGSSTIVRPGGPSQMAPRFGGGKTRRKLRR